MSKKFPERFFLMLLRKKIVPNRGSEETSPLTRSLTLFNLCMYGVGAMCGGYIYGVSIVLVATKSGASSFLSNMIAGVIAALNAQCYVELSSRLPYGGGGYNFTYMICGELLAFIAGWAMLLEYLLAFSFSSVGASNAIDILANRTINSAIVSYIGRFPNTYGYLSETPNILAALVAILVVIVLGLGAKISVGINSMITICSTVILMVCAIFMAVKSNILQFTSYRHLNQTLIANGRSDWMPFGFIGVLGGAALTFNAFIGFDAMALTGDVVIDPSRTVPLSTNIAIIVVFCVTTFYYLCLSFYLPWFMIDPKLGLSGVFYNQGIFPMKIIACIGEVTGYLTSGFANMFALSHIVFSLSRDGLLFPCFHYISKTFQVPVITNLVFGLIAALLALLFDLNILANFMSAGTLITYTMVSIDLLIIRLINVDKVEVMLPDDKTGTKLSIKSISFTPCVERACFSAQMITKPACFIVSLFVLVISITITSYLSSSHLVNITSKISVLTIFSFFAVLACVVIFLFKYYIPEDGFKVKPMPLVPVTCIILNIVLATNLQILVWCRLGIWLLLGLCCYVFYGMWHSDLSIDDEETECLLPNSPQKNIVLETK